MPKRIVVVGASSGGIEALKILAAGLPESFPAPICVVQHTSPESPGVMGSILDRAGALPARLAEDGERLKPGTIYVAPPDRHLIIEPTRLRLTKGPRENRFRPAIDPLFRSAAQVFGPAAIGVILTGNLDDGTSGLWTIKQMGGIAVVQDPQDAENPSMPLNASRYVTVDHVAPLSQMPALLARLASEPIPPPGGGQMPERTEVEVRIAAGGNALDSGLENISTPSEFACPECHGVLRQLEEGGRWRFRCHTGHAYSVDSLIGAVGEGVDQSLWNAIRALEEAGLLLHRTARMVAGRADAAETARLDAESTRARAHSDAIRRLAAERDALKPSPSTGDERAPAVANSDA